LLVATLIEALIVLIMKSDFALGNDNFNGINPFGLVIQGNHKLVVV
jgi:hypothetical protein